MGILLSKFRKKLSTKEVLEDIQKKIDDIEEYKENTEKQRKSLVGSLVIYSIVLYLISTVIVYVYYMPRELNDILLCATPFAIFPFLIYLLKRVLTWYYRRKERNTESQLKQLRSEKKKILDDVMEKETYKVAKEILEEYAPDQLRQSLLGKSPVSSKQLKAQPTTPLMSSASPGGTDVRRRIISTANSGGHQQSPSFSVQPRSSLHPITPGHGPYTSPGPRSLPISNTPIPTSSQGGFIHVHQSRSTSEGPPPGPPMPRPVLPRERGVVDRLIEYLVGDGPANRYALVCRQCESHNGMALKEEFEYIAFRCAYCHYWNHARKQRPTAPPLENPVSRPLPPPPISSELEEDSSSSEETSSKEEVNDVEGEEKKEIQDEEIQEDSVKDEVTSTSSTSEIAPDTTNSSSLTNLLAELPPECKEEKTLED